MVFLPKLGVRSCDFVLFHTLHWMPHWYLEQGNMDPKKLGEEMLNVIPRGLILKFESVNLVMTW
jgi:hypothetical protein